jgi:hypothetical protein
MEYAIRPFEGSPLLFAFCIVFIPLMFLSFLGLAFGIYENGTVRNKTPLFKRKMRLRALKKIRRRDLRSAQIHTTKTAATTWSLF